MVVRYHIPYSDATSLSPEQRQAFVDADEPLCFGHTLGDQIGGQLEAGFVLIGMYEDRQDPADQSLSEFIDPYMATLALKT